MTIQVEIGVEDDQLAVMGSFRVPYVDWGMKDPSVFVHRVEKHVDVTVKVSGRLSPDRLRRPGLHHDVEDPKTRVR